MVRDATIHGHLNIGNMRDEKKNLVIAEDLVKLFDMLPGILAMAQGELHPEVGRDVVYDTMDFGVQFLRSSGPRHVNPRRHILLILLTFHLAVRPGTIET